MVPGVEDRISGLETKALLPAELRARARVYEFILGEDMSKSSSDVVSDIRTQSLWFSLESSSVGPQAAGNIKVVGLPGYRVGKGKMASARAQARSGMRAASLSSLS